MRVLIVSTNREKAPFAVAPVGAAKIVASLRASGHEAGFLDLCFSRNITYRLRKTLRTFRPDMIGLSIRNLDNCAYVHPHAYFESDRKIIRIIRGVSRAPVIIGGSAVSVAAGELAEYLEADFAIAGEGEKSLPAFLSAFPANSGFEDVPGLWWRQNGRWRGNGPLFSSSLGDLPLQAYDCIDYGRYFSTGGFVAVQTKRGCPFDCIYCPYGALEGKRPRYFPAGACVDEMEKIVRDTGRSDFFSWTGCLIIRFGMPRPCARKSSGAG